MVKISVIMPVYNEKFKEIFESINSILNQNFKDFELIIIDDNPKLTKLKTYLKHERAKDDRIKLLFNKFNMGLVKSENKGIKYSSGKYIARMDADDIAERYRLYLQLRFLLKNNLDCISCNCALFLDNRIINKNFVSKYSQYNQCKIKRALLHFNFANGSTLMFKRKAFDIINGYRVKNIDDYDLVTRMIVYGFKVGYQSQILMYKRQRSISISNSNTLKQFMGFITVRNFLNHYNFKKVAPIQLIYNSFNKLNYKDIRKFNIARHYFSLLKSNVSIKFLLKMFRIIFSSPFIVRYCLWSKIINYRKNSLLK